MSCAFCSETQVKHYQICVDGEPLRLSFHLCAAHGAVFLLNVGKTIGELFKEYR